MNRPRARTGQIDLILRSGLFHRAWIAAQLKRQFGDDREAVAAYLDAPSCSPHPLFSVDWVVAGHKGRSKDVDPLVWYLTTAEANQNVSPHPLVDLEAMSDEDPAHANSTFGPLASWLGTAPLTRTLPGAVGDVPVTLGGAIDASLRAVAEWQEQEARRAAPRTSSRPPAGLLAGPVRQIDHEGPEPLVTVVMPVFNRATAVRAAIESVRRQSFRNWELVVVDDGSEDDSVAVVAGIAAYDERIRCLRGQHRGVSAARNVGVEAARGRYTAFLDTDNTWEPDFLAVMLGELEHHGWDMAHAALRAEREGAVYYRAFEGSHLHLLAANYVDLNVFVARTDLVREVGGFDEGLRRGVDYDLILRLSSTTEPHLVPYVGVQYHDDEEDPGRISTSETPAWLSKVANKHLIDWTDQELRQRVAGRTSLVLAGVANVRSVVRWLELIGTHPDLELVLVGQRPRVTRHVLLRVLQAAYPRLVLAHALVDRGVQVDMNLGFAAASGDRLVLVSEPLEHVLEPLRRLVDTPLDDACVAQPVVIDRRNRLIGAAGAVFAGTVADPYPFLAQHPVADLDVPGPVAIPAALGPVFAITSAAFAALGGLDPLFPDAFAETDLSLRAHQRGLGGTVLLPDARCLPLRTGPVIPGLEPTRPDGEDTDATEVSEATEAIRLAEEARVRRLLRSRTRRAPLGSDEAWRLVGYEQVAHVNRPCGPPPASPTDRPLLVVEPVIRPLPLSPRAQRIEEGLPALRWTIDLPSPAGQGGESWGDTHYGRAVAAALERLGQHVDVDNRAARHRSSRDLDDVILVLRGLDRVEPRPGALNIEWIISHPDLISREEAAGYDLVYAASTSWSRERSEEWGLDIRPLLQATDTTLFNPGRAPFDSGDDALFVGNARRVYRRSLRYAIAAGAKVTVHGQGWDPFLGADAVASTLVDNRELGAMYAAAGVVLNDHWEDMRQQGFISNRLMDAAASGARVVSDVLPGVDLTSMFHGLVHTFDSQEELASILAARDELYPSDSERVSAAALVAAEHSFDARAQTMLEDVLAVRP